MRNSAGFTLVELLISLAIIAALAGIATTNFYAYVGNAQDKAALNDYRNIKLALTDLLTDENAPNRIAIRRASGPMTLPAPMQAISLSPKVRLDFTYVRRVRRNGRVRTTTNIDVFNQEGSVRYRYRERNGVVREQEIALR